jgi:hypothetical protein
MFNANISSISAYRGVKDALMLNANINHFSIWRNVLILKQLNWQEP